MSDLAFTHTIEIKSLPDQVFHAMVDPSEVVKYHFVPLAKIDLRVGGSIQYGANGHLAINGTILEVIPDRLLVHTFEFTPESHANAIIDPASRVTYALEPIDGGTRLMLTHDGFQNECQTLANIRGGWPFIMDELKKLLESK